VSEIFQSTVPPLELILRGSLMYLGLILTFRFVLRRDVGSVGMADVLFIVLVADASQNAMAGEYRSLSDGVILVATLVVWNVLLDWLAYHNTAIRRLVEPPPLPLIRDGHFIRRNLRSQWITVEEVQSKLREHGIDNVRSVKRAALEPDGELSVIRVDGADNTGPRPKHIPG